MALRVKTVEYAFTPGLANVATNTTLATSTRYDAPALTLTIPETTSRTFRSVKLMISWRDAFGAAASITGWRVGIKLGAVAFADTDYTTAVANTGENEGGFITHDVTSYFVTNFGAGSSQTAQAGFTMSTSAVAAFCNTTMKLLITYEYDDAGLISEVKTVRIPIQSYHTTLTTAQIEIGTVTGTTNAPANQIPQLTGTGGFLPETSVAVQRAWIEWWANDGGAAATDFALIYQIDATTEVTHVTLESALATGVIFHTHSIYDTATHVTTSAHALKARSALTARFPCIGAVLHVTYTYNPSATNTVLNSVCFPIGGDEVPPGYINGTTSADEDALSVNLWVEEPGVSSTIKQSGVLLYVTSAGGGTLNVMGGSQTYRPYTLPALVNVGGYALIHRVDHSSGFTWGRGLRENLVKTFFGTANAATMTGGLAYINYHSAVATTGINTHNKTTYWSLDDMLPAGTVAFQKEIATTNQRTPNLPETNYWINRLGYDVFVRQGAASMTINLLTQKAAGEHNGDGWYPLGMSTYTNDTELGTHRFTFPALVGFNRTPFNTDAMALETARKYRLQSTASSMMWLAGMWLTYHSMTFSVTGTISGSAGGSVTVTAYDTTDKKALGSTSRTGNGTFTVTVYDNARTNYVEARETDTYIGRSANDVAFDPNTSISPSWDLAYAKGRFDAAQSPDIWPATFGTANVTAANHAQRTAHAGGYPIFDYSASGATAVELTASSTAFTSGVTNMWIYVVCDLDNISVNGGISSLNNALAFFGGQGIYFRNASGTVYAGYRPSTAGTVETDITSKLSSGVGRIVVQAKLVTEGEFDFQYPYLKINNDAWGAAGTPGDNNDLSTTVTIGKNMDGAILTARMRKSAPTDAEANYMAAWGLAL